MGFSGVRDVVWGQSGDVCEGLTRTEWKSDLIHSKEICGAPVMCRPRCEAWGPGGECVGTTFVLQERVR